MKRKISTSSFVEGDKGDEGHPRRASLIEYPTGESEMQNVARFVSERSMSNYSKSDIKRNYSSFYQKWQGLMVGREKTSMMLHVRKSVDFNAKYTAAQLCGSIMVSAASIDSEDYGNGHNDISSDDSEPYKFVLSLHVRFNSHTT